MIDYELSAKRIAALYSQEFGGKSSGRFRVAAKQLRELLGVRRIYEDDVTRLSRCMLNEGYVLIDMDSFYVVLSANAFVNYRRANAESLNRVMDIE